MFTTEIKVFDRFDEITDLVEQQARRATQAAAETGAVVANAEAFIPLELQIIPVHGDLEGYTAGIKSHKKSRSSNALIANFFDSGTLAGRTKKLKRPRRASWPVNRGGSSSVSHRHPIVPGEGIEAQHFFAKARAAGRKTMAEIIERGL